MLVLTSCRVVVYPVYDTYQLCCQSLRFQNQPPLTWWVPTTTSSSSLSTSDGTILLQVATHSLPLLLLIFNFYTFYFTRDGFRKYGWQLKTIFSHASVTIIIIIHTYLGYTLEWLFFFKIFLKYQNSSNFLCAVETSSPISHWITPDFRKKVITLLYIYFAKVGKT